MPDDETRRRRDLMRQRVKMDLALQGLTSADLEGMERDTHVEGSAVTGWTWRVLLSGGREALVYQMSNRAGAPLRRDGEPIPEPDTQ